MSNPSPKTVLLQGEPGSGKSMMIGDTAIHRPVHFIDVDRKIKSAGWAQPLLASGDMTVWELKEAIDDTNMKSRIRQLTGKEGPSVQPKGWEGFSEYCYKLPTLEEGKRAGTWAVDSCTLLNEHLKTQIMYLCKRSKFTFDQWNALKIGWMDSFNILRDQAIEHGKDLMFTVHERNKEEPGEKTTGVKTETVNTMEGVQNVKVYTGTQDVNVWASIDGAFGQLIGAQTDEYYHLYIKIENGVPKWRCRVQPDGKRNLRTSFKARELEYEPDFRKIWK